MRKRVALGLIIVTLVAVGLVVADCFSFSFTKRQTNQNGSTLNIRPSSAVSSPLNDYLTPQNPPPGSIIVPDDFPTINQAVANASAGQAIFVRAGQYNESVTVDKSVWLIGQNNTCIDAHSTGPDLLVCHSNVNITGFTMQNTPTPATGSWIEQMQGIGLPIQLSDIEVVNSSRCNIYANNLTNGLNGVYLENSQQNNIVKNVFTNDGSGCISGGFLVTGGNGVELDASSTNTVAYNLFSGCGLKVENNSQTNSLFNNTICGAGNALMLDSSSGNILRNNNLTHDFYYFEVNGSQVSDFINNVDASNTIDGKPICYLIGKSNIVVPSDSVCIVLVNCVNVTVSNPILSLDSYSVILANTTLSNIIGCELGHVDPAFLSEYSTSTPPLNLLLYDSSNNKLSQNHATIWMDYSDSNLVTQNDGTLNLYSSNANTMTGNQLEGTGYDAIDWAGVCLQDSSNNIVSENTISGGGCGVSIFEASRNNTVASNDVADNTNGIIISDFEGDIIGSASLNDAARPSFNVIYCNNITANANEGVLDCGYCTDIIGNDFTENYNCGLDLSNSQNCTIIGNSIDGLWIGIIGNNTINTLVVANNITVNRATDEYGTWLLSAYPVTFYDNNFLAPVNCSHYAEDYTNSTTPDCANCIWDNGSQGNYWSTYTGTSSNGNGIGDTPYYIGFGFYDNYPLMTPYNIAQAIPSLPPNLSG